ncbi:MAG: 3-phosphoserine/phosphohydroxythreonine transaminase [Rickettsiales bacterium]|jgi:phosphoserine aminotransferase|nr:3-phosphoserine/phosphohydroxythreonine transaminase [Rickettsiales bacterium]
MRKTYNFSAGPAMLPQCVIEQAAAEMADYRGSGQSVMEMSHRSAIFGDIMARCEQSMRLAMSVPDNYKILFMQGGASLQFSMVPLNLGRNGKAAYVDTGIWADMAAQEAGRFIDVDIIASSRSSGYARIPFMDKISGGYDYAHITLNNTVEGTAWHSRIPETGALVGDASSCILAEEIDVSKFGLVYAGAQKNLGIAGLTVAIVREDLIMRDIDGVPELLKYSTYADNLSMYNTPPCWAIYMTGLVLDWVLGEGGVGAMERRNAEKSRLLYDFIDNSRIYTSLVEKESRSFVNIPFFIRGGEELERKFVREAEEVGLCNLAGHKSVGGIRASLYNAMPLEGVRELINFMEKFERENAFI